ncbi:copine-8 isoform X2 [Poeciliopsis prolifica]|uniref:copine-8 isoform X2 n=1 Tax=Poeciliopsis prolifica TaxID=188132 RepID=UPI002414341E|nr:copine-8 isoform X2 [Poeciliopsis prolifica]
MNNTFLNMASIGDFDPLNPSIPATKVEIAVSCRDLLDMDTFSKSDPICVLYTQGMGNKEWREFGRTEVIDNTLNPDFVKKFILDYFFEERQNLRFDLYDVDSKSANLQKHDFLGQAYCTLGEVVGSQGSRLEKPLGGIQGKKCGTIIVKAEELNNCRESVMIQFCGTKLDKKDFFGKSDPFLVFYRSNEDGTFTICHKTEVVKNTLNPVWQAFKIPVRALCNGDYDRSIKVEVYDWDRDGSHDYIGEFMTSYRELSVGQSQFNVYECPYSSPLSFLTTFLDSFPSPASLLSFCPSFFPLFVFLCPYFSTCPSLPLLPWSLPFFLVFFFTLLLMSFLSFLFLDLSCLSLLTCHSPFLLSFLFSSLTVSVFSAGSIFKACSQ